jgi:hypothetical protein
LGKDDESLDSVRVNAPFYYKTQGGIPVLLPEYEQVLKNGFGEYIQQVKAVYTSADNITFYLLLRDKTLTDLSSDFEDYWERKCHMNINLNYANASTRSQDISATLYVMDGYIQNDVKAEVIQTIENFFELGVYPIATNFIPTQLESLIAEVEGVRIFKVTSPNVTEIVVNSNEILYLGNLNLNVTGGVS